MGRKCAPGCKSGYESQTSKNPEAETVKLSFHAFPRDRVTRETWRRSIPRDWDPPPNSFLCSLHFTANDFVGNSQDSNNSRRAKKSQGLRRNILKPDSVPSVFPIVPSYLSKPTVQPRSEASTSKARHEQDEICQEAANDQIQDLQTLQERLKDERLPKGTQICAQDSTLTLYQITLQPGKAPAVKFALVIDKELKFRMC